MNNALYRNINVIILRTEKNNFKNNGMYHLGEKTTNPVTEISSNITLLKLKNLL